jgi:Fe-S-cluster containining protein
MDRKLLRAVPSGKIEIVWDGTFTRVEFNCDCTEANPICRGMCCRWRTGYSVELEPEEEPYYESIPHPTRKDVRILSPNKDRTWCTYFDENKGLCKIYKTRPKMCRQWHCSPGGQPEDTEIERRDAGWALFPVRMEEANFVQYKET